MSDGTFLVSISGQLEYIEAFVEAGSDWYCKYEFVTGPDWKLIGGIEAGLSQICSVNRNGEKIVLNLPIEVMLKSTNVYGWPQLVLSVYKNMTLEGYGRCHIPLTPGTHGLDIFLSKPLTSTFLGYIASFFGYQPELLQPKMLATTAGNQLLRMTSTGQVKATISVVTQGFKNLGYDVGRVR
ncbi:B9 domain-containing protein 1 [Harmonia axyridis]|uniref:B9 domain-containing protein 1 n=1 Tax=Harmonia axyridis TaxID=115357 RepID=UPI001E2789B3|nr:B9 domain-containing protein 1 [Harmonia axyridis]